MTTHGLDQSPARRIVGLEDFPGRAEQAALIFFRNVGEQLSILGNRLEQFGSLSQAFFKMVRHSGRRNMSILTDAGRSRPSQLRVSSFVFGTLQFRLFRIRNVPQPCFLNTFANF